jgi:hypothetical protein
MPVGSRSRDADSAGAARFEQWRMDPSPSRPAAGTLAAACEPASQAEYLAYLSGLADLVVNQVWTNDFEQAIGRRTRRKEANVLAVSAH